MQELGDPPPDIISSMSGGLLPAQGPTHEQGTALSQEIQQLMNQEIQQDGLGDDVGDDDRFSDEEAMQLRDKCAMQ